MDIKCEALTASPLNVCFTTFWGLDFNNSKSGTISKPLEMLQGFQKITELKQVGQTKKAKLKKNDKINIQNTETVV